MLRIDAHIHHLGDHPDDVAQLRELGWCLLNVCIPRPDPSWRRDKEIYRDLARRQPSQFAWCGGFDPPCREDFEDPDRWIEGTLREIDADLASGAVAIKIWKCVGMEVRKPDGSYLTVDDPILEPIFEHMAAADTTLLTHIGEPRACWRPLSEDGPHTDYYRRHPEWHMVDRPDMPSHEALVASRDRVVERHPGLRCVGAHLASLEFDVAEVAARLDRYPNFAVDTSSRLLDLAMQDRVTVCEFFRRYRDRILFGTDIVQRRASSSLDADERRARLDAERRRRQAELEFLSGRKPVTIRGRRVEGLGLGDELVEELCTVNPRRWYPRLAAGSARHGGVP